MNAFYLKNVHEFRKTINDRIEIIRDTVLLWKNYDGLKHFPTDPYRLENNCLVPWKNFCLCTINIDRYEVNGPILMWLKA